MPVQAVLRYCTDYECEIRSLRGQMKSMIQIISIKFWICKKSIIQSTFFELLGKLLTSKACIRNFSPGWRRIFRLKTKLTWRFSSCLLLRNESLNWMLPYLVFLLKFISHKWEFPVLAARRSPRQLKEPILLYRKPFSWHCRVHAEQHTRQQWLA